VGTCGTDDKYEGRGVEEKSGPGATTPQFEGCLTMVSLDPRRGGSGRGQFRRMTRWGGVAIVATCRVIRRRGKKSIRHRGEAEGTLGVEGV